MEKLSLFKEECAGSPTKMGVLYCQGCSEKGVCVHKGSTVFLEEEDVRNPNQVEIQATKLFPMYACFNSARL